MLQVEIWQVQTIAPDKTILDLEVDAFRKVVDLNLFGMVLPTMAFVDVMAKNKKGVIVNFCSESALRPLTRVVGYGSAKAAIANYTRYMATELATKFSLILADHCIFTFGYGKFGRLLTGIQD